MQKRNGVKTVPFLYLYSILIFKRFEVHLADNKADNNKAAADKQIECEAFKPEHNREYAAENALEHKYKACCGRAYIPLCHNLQTLCHKG